MVDYHERTLAAGVVAALTPRQRAALHALVLSELGVAAIVEELDEAARETSRSETP